MPEPQGAVLLERGHPAEDLPLINERRHSPLQGFLDLRAGSMHLLTNVNQNRLRKFGGLLNVSVDLGIATGHAGVRNAVQKCNNVRKSTQDFLCAASSQILSAPPTGGSPPVRGKLRPSPEENALD